MARYIDADILIEQVGSLEQLARKRVYDTPTNSPIYEMYSTQYIERERMLCIIKANPTADVAPRAEVAREVIEAIEALMFAYKKYSFSEIYYEHGLANAIDELKKKYTEGEK